MAKHHQHTVVEGGEVGGQVQEAILEHHMQERQEGQATGLPLYVAHRVGWQGATHVIREVGHMEQGFPRGAGDARCLDILPVTLLQEQGFPRGAEPIPENLRSKALADVDFRIWLEGRPLSYARKATWNFNGT